MRLKLRFALVAGTFAILLTPAEADPVPAGFIAQIAYYNGTSTLPILDQSTPFIAASSASQASYSGCVISTATQSACGTGRAAMGDLGAESTMIELNPATIPGGYEDANASGYFNDILTVTGSGLTAGQTYTLVPTVTIDGTGSWNNVALPDTVGFAIQEFGPDGSTIIDNIFQDATQSSYSAAFTLDGISFQPGVQFNLALQFGEAARIFAGAAADENTEVTANFLSTMLLTGITVLDSNGNAVDSFAIQSASGTNYGANGVVPEPASFILLGLGILAMGIVRLTRSRFRANHTVPPAL